MAMAEPPLCADCGAPAGGPPGPPEGWRLEDADGIRIVCHSCFTADFRATVRAQQLSQTLKHFRNTNP